MINCEDTAAAALSELRGTWIRTDPAQKGGGRETKIEYPPLSCLSSVRSLSTSRTQRAHAVTYSFKLACRLRHKRSPAHNAPIAANQMTAPVNQTEAQPIKIELLSPIGGVEFICQLVTTQKISLHQGEILIKIYTWNHFRRFQKLCWFCVLTP